MDKSDAIKIIHEAVEIFDRQLKGKSILILAKKEKCIISYTLSFHEKNFKHFTGVDSKLSAIDFYQRTIKKNLTVNDILFKDSFLAEQKMNILKQAMQLPYTARMLGDFNYAGIKIQADIGSGNTHYTMAFRTSKDDNFYPVSVLEEDIRKSTKATSPIVAILRKNSNDKIYDEITYKDLSRINLYILLVYFPDGFLQKASRYLGTATFSSLPSKKYPSQSA